MPHRIRDLVAAGTRGNAGHWMLLAALSLAFVLLLELVHLPAALLIGTMIAAICLAARETTIRIGSLPFLAAQGLIGCMVGSKIPLTVVGELANHGVLFLFGVAAVIVAASVIGLVLTRMRVLPGTTAIWGTSPGASTPMILMSEHYGGDMRLVAVMQYVRIAAVAVVATVVAKLGSGGSGPAAAASATVWFPAVTPIALIAVLVIGLGGAALATALRIPAGPVLVPVAGVMALEAATGLHVDPPPWLNAISYAIVGWSIGLRFTRPILRHALRAMPAILGSTVVLIAICGLIGGALVLIAGTDPLTAYLATSPGGLDSVAIIAASSRVDLKFVLAMQTSRLIIAMVVFPMIARRLATRESPATTPPTT